MKFWRWTLQLLAVCLAMRAGSAAAHDVDDAVPGFVSPERFVLEIRGGPYKPDMGGNPAFDTYFSSDHGPMLAVELDMIAWRLPDILYIAGGGRIGTTSFTGKTLSEANEQTAQETSLSLLPLDLLAVVRVDALSRLLSIPLIVTGKIGYEWSHWSTSTEGADDHDGWSVGLVYGAQLALELDILDRSAARNLDEEWGINHSFLFAELFKFSPSDASLPIGDSSWTIGLGFVF